MTYVIQVRPLLLFVDGDLFYSEFGVEQVTIHKQEQRPHLNHNSYLLVTVRVTTEKQKTVDTLNHIKFILVSLRRVRLI